MRNHLPLVSLIAVLWLNSTATADKAPMSAEGLQNEAEVVVMATIEKIRIETEASQFEGSGNWDWGIYLTLRVETVEKGSFEGETLEARCFRIKSRRSSYEYLTPQGHDPIPEIGTRLKAYLKQGPSSWEVVLPNGLSPVPEGGQKSSEPLPDGKQVAELRSLMYTYLLPLESWLLVLLIGIPVLLLALWFRKRKKPDSVSRAVLK